MADISDYLETKILEHVLDATTFTSPASVWVLLGTADFTDAFTTANEVPDANAYARVQMTGGWTVSGDNATNTAAVTFPAASGGNWGTVTHVGIADSATHGAGNLLFHGAIDDDKVVEDGDTFEFAIGALSVTIA